MLQIILIILLSIAGSAGGIWAGYVASTQVPDAETSTTAHGSKAEPVFLTPELFVVPLVTKSTVQGYFVCRLVFEIDPSIPPAVGVNEDTLLADQFYQVSFKGEFYDLENRNIPDVSKLVDTLVANLNELTADSRYTRVYVQQVDLFERSEVRKKVVEDRFDNAG